MIANKKLTAVIALLTLAACVFTMVFLLWPQALHIAAASAPPDYAELFYSDHVMTVDITVDEDDWADMLENAINEEYIACDVAVDGNVITSVGLRPKGNSSLSTVYSSDSDRYSFKLEFDHYVDGQTLLGLDKFVLNNIQSDATYMKEYLSYDLMAQMGVPTPLCCFAQINVNGEPWGLYLAIEALEESFAQRCFGSSYGQLYKPDTMGMGGGMGRGGEGETPDQPPGGGEGFQPPEEREAPDGAEAPADRALPEGGRQDEESPGRSRGGMGGGSNAADLQYIDDDPASYSAIFDSAVFDTTESDQARLIEALRKLSAGEDLEETVDVDEVLRYFACNAALVNLDSYLSSMKHNYYLYEKDGQLSMLPWDYNLSFAAFQAGSASAAVNFPIDTPVSGVDLEERPILAKLLENDAYKAKYHQYLHEIVSKYWNEAVFNQKIQELDALIGAYVEADPTAFYTYEEYQAALPMLQTFVSLRCQSIAGQLYGAIPSTTAGQQEEPDALIDAGSVDLAVMGQQGGGGGFGDRGPGPQGAAGGEEPARGEREGGQLATGEPPSDSPDEGLTAQGNTAPEGTGDEGQRDHGRETGNRGDRSDAAQPAGNFGPGRAGPAQPSGQADDSSILWLAVCLASMAAALAFARLYRRRKA